MNDLPNKQEELLTLLENPYTGNSFTFENGMIVDVVTKEKFPVKNDIPKILRNEKVLGSNRKQQKGYDLFSRFYDLLYKLNILDLEKWLAEMFEQINVESGDWILETSVGTGRQLLNLKRRGVDGVFFGSDISYGMLQQCRKNLNEWEIDAGLVQANAEALPFKDGLFDVVFHVGGFNFFNDKKAAIEEMIRVAKSGALLYIVDETDSIRESSGIISKIADRCMPAHEFYLPPVEYIPDNMSNIINRRLLDGKFWMVSFQKP